MRKVKFCQDCFDEKLGAILTEFPMLDDLHPFLSSLMNVLYDKNHYKLALGQLRTARHLIDHVAKDYCRLLKFGDSLYRCKQLKKAALGRMATIMKRQKDPLAYLEQVRQHISRLPAIDPNTRTLLVCGYPNVGKSSFINKVTRADVDVQPYAFTTKSLFVGHLDYKYLRWQVIDTPGILDHPLEEMNTIEMQSITAMAHLKSAILYFMDLSEQCGYTVEAQCKLFHSIKPLFATKPTVLVLNKIDVMKLEELHPDNRALVQEIIDTEGVICVQTSCATEEGVMDLKNKACDALLAHRVDLKMKGSKITSVANRIHVAQPKPRDDVVRAPCIPDAVKNRKKFDKDDPDRPRLLRDEELEQGGAGVYNINIKRDYLLANPEWKFDIMPEFMDGKNVADFVDPDIADKLEALEREEERLEAEGFYANEEEMFDSDDEREALEMVDRVGHKNAAQMGKKGTKNQARLPRTAGLRTITELTEQLTKAGYDPSRIQERAEMLAKIQGAKSKRKRDDDDDEDVDMESGDDEDGFEDEDMDVDGGAKKVKKVKTNSGRAVPKRITAAREGQMSGLRDERQLNKTRELHKFAQRPRNALAKAGEADRKIQTKMPRHLFAGKRKGGKTDRR
ncbi:GTP binding protein 4 [Ephemerocybe angulata]|uniref:Nucleolar GTP-binding protein 1 n=1 Tax=Ephemerocybe angulata TaxID=980116 RepID=A0A8H6LY66_9AGAR|nr:GTP binding protein 4 [Tulosesus angulatus]